MPTIDQLNSTSSLSDSDLMVIFSSANGDARKVSLGDFITFLNQQPASIIQVAAAFNTIYSAVSINGGPNALAITTNGMPAASNTLQLILVTPTQTNTGAVSIAFDNGATLQVSSPSGAPNPVLQAGDWRLGVTYLLAVSLLGATILFSNSQW